MSEDVDSERDSDLTETKKLQQSCVDCFLENFQLFMGAYRSSGSTLLKHFEFLQRRYSQDVFEALKTEECFLENLDFILNPHMKDITFNEDDLNADNIVPVIRRLKTIGSTIIQLTLPGSVVSVDLLLQLTDSLPNIESLDLQGANVSSEVLKNLGSHCHVLKALNLSYCHGMSDSTLRDFCTGNESTSTNTNVTLESLNLKHTDVTPEGLSFALRHFPNLATLCHGDLYKTIYDMHINDYLNGSLPDVKYNLDKLEISCILPNQTEGLKLCSVVCPRVSQLEVEISASQADVAACEEFCELQEMCFGHFRDFVTISPFVQTKGRNLTFLGVTGGYISAALILKNCPKLQRLYLDNTKFESLKEVSSSSLRNYTLRNLDTLYISGIDFGNENDAKSVKFLLSSNLKSVYFFDAKNLTLEFSRCIAQCRCMATVQSFSTIYSDIDFEAAKEIISAAPELKKFSIEYCKVSFLESGDQLSLNDNMFMQWYDDISAFFYYEDTLMNDLDFSTDFEDANNENEAV